MTVVTNSLTITDSTPKVRGFGTALIAGYHTHFNGVREYSADSDGLLGMISDGFTLDEEIYNVASVYCSQNPHGASFKVGKLTTNTSSFTLTILNAIEGDVYSVWIKKGSNTADLYSYTAPNGATTTTIATALEALIDDDTGITSSAAVAVITCTAASLVVPIKVRGYTSNIAFEEVGVATNYATDLAATLAADSDWYGLLCAGTSAAQLAACQTFAEANSKLFFGLSADSDCYDGASSTDALAVAEASGLNRSFTFPTRDQAGRLDAAAMALLFSYAPPKIVAMHGKKVAGPIVDAWTPTERGVIATKKGIAYYEELGLPMLHDGWAASGRFYDVTLLADWVVSRINESLVYEIANNDTIPFSPVGEAIVQKAISVPLAAADSAKVIEPAGSPNGGWFVTVPPSSEVSVIDRTQRKYPGCKYSFRALGSMQTIDVTGTMGF